MRVGEKKLRKLIREELALNHLRQRVLREVFDAQETARDLLRMVHATGGNLDQTADQVSMMMASTAGGYDDDELRAVYGPFLAGAKRLGIDVDSKQDELKKVILALRGN